jgi:hypothetical protein
MMKKIRFPLIALLLITGSLSGCTTMGSGTGTVRNSKAAVTFDWKSKDSVSGTMTATFADGKTFTGQYFQLTTDVQGDSWRGWRSWRSPGLDFATFYSGRAVARLKGPDDSLMRCWFMLIHPSHGLHGGADGECQLPDKTEIDVSLDSRK